MFHLTDAFLVCPLLLLFTPLVAFHQWDVSEALGKRVKHLYIKESPLPPIPPKTSSLDVNPGVVGGDCTAQRHLFSRQCLKGWFHSDAMAYLRHEAGCDVPQLIVPHRIAFRIYSVRLGPLAPIHISGTEHHGMCSCTG